MIVCCASGLVVLLGTEATKARECLLNQQSRMFIRLLGLQLTSSLLKRLYIPDIRANIKPMTVAPTVRLSPKANAGHVHSHSSLADGWIPAR